MTSSAKLETCMRRGVSSQKMLNWREAESLWAWGLAAGAGAGGSEARRRSAVRAPRIIFCRPW